MHFVFLRKRTESIIQIYNTHMHFTTETKQLKSITFNRESHSVNIYIIQEMYRLNS